MDNELGRLTDNSCIIYLLWSHLKKDCVYEQANELMYCVTVV